MRNTYTHTTDMAQLLMGEPNATANSDQQKPQTGISRRSPDKVETHPLGTGGSWEPLCLPWR